MNINSKLNQSELEAGIVIYTIHLGALTCWLNEPKFSGFSTIIPFTGNKSQEVSELFTKYIIIITFTGGFSFELLLFELLFV